MSWLGLFLLLKNGAPELNRLSSTSDHFSTVRYRFRKLQIHAHI